MRCFRVAFFLNCCANVHVFNSLLMSVKANSPVPIDRFTHNPQVLEIIRQMQEKFGASYEKLIVSDLLDENGNQYANLVQEGGGALGVALVGLHLYSGTGWNSLFQACRNQCWRHKYDHDCSYRE